MTEGKIDLFRYDIEETPREFADPLLAKIAKIGEADVPSIFLQGTIAGSSSQEDPNFKIIMDSTEGPAGINLTGKEILDCQVSSIKRHRTDPQYTGLLDSYHAFTIGKGVTITPEDESEEVDKYLKDFIKHNKFDGMDGDIVASIFEAGELFVRFFFTNAGLVARIPVIKLLQCWEISKIEYSENGAKEPLFYIRPYKEKDSSEIKEERIPADEIIHIKFAKGYEKRGLPPFLSVIQQCQYYLDWLFCRIVFNRLKVSYYLEEITDSSPAGVKTQDETTPETTGYAGKSGQPQKRLPKIGSKLVHNRAVEYKWLKPEVGADDAKEDGRSIRLSICAGAQIPEFILGDASNANYSSALVAQNPFIRKIELFRDFFGRYFIQIFEKVIIYGIQHNFLPSRSKETVMKEKASNVGLIRRLKKVFSFNEKFDAFGNIIVQNDIDTKTGIDIQWPNLIAEKLLEDSQAYQIHQAMGIVSNETLSNRLGYDFEEEMRKIKREEAANPPDEPEPDLKRDGEANQDEPMPGLKK